MAVRVEIQSEEAAGNRPARVLVFEDGKIVAEVVARVEMKPGAYDRSYPCVTLEKK